MSHTQTTIVRCLTVLLIICFYATSTLGGIPEVLEKCCDVGRQWFAANRETCAVYPSLVPDILPEDRPACSAVVDLCCMTQRQDKQCSMGKQSARIRRSCDGLNSRLGSEHARECCNCCNLGIMAHDASLPCSLMSHFGVTCDSAFQECCNNGRHVPRATDFVPSTTTTITTTTELNVPSRAELVGGSPDADLGICAKFPGQLCAHICINTPDSYECTCREGFTLQSDRRTCRQDRVGNRCDVSNPCQHQCVDTGVAIHCQCFEGYVLESDGRNCRDIDECLLGRHLCNSDQRCVNMDGSYSCEGPSAPTTTDRCSVGFSWNQRISRCEDIDECTISRDACNGQQCVNTVGSFTCHSNGAVSDAVDEAAAALDGDDDDDDELHAPTSNDMMVVPDPTVPSDPFHLTTTPSSRPHPRCGTGFHFNRHSMQCEDVNECLLASVRRSCSLPHQQCRNTVGSFMCVNMCGVGYRYIVARHYCEDINECALNQDSCLEGQTCENTIGSYACRRVVSCGTGYTLDQATQTCLDDDECRLGTHNCGVARDCHNIEGSFRCVPRECPRGYKLDFRSGNCDPVICPRGLEPDEAGNCIDINECIDRPEVCRPNQECRNTIGSYTCRNLITCGAGYELSDDGTRCEDVDECQRGTHDCTGVLMHCVNRPGTYLCQCADGFQMNHAVRSCEDLDECTFGSHVCSQNARCENTHGSYRCTCKEGFESEGDGRSCKDIDECSRPGMCQHTCRNTWGSFQCTCDEGYQIAADGRSCDDVDECRAAAEQGQQVCIGVCENTHGSFVCTCPAGYQMASDGRTCQDIDECVLRTANCHGADDVCINTRGGYKCQAVTCPKGFIKSPVAGNRNNNVKCQRKTFLCPQGDVECLYAPLSYSTNFISFPSRIRIPADLFTMRGPLSPYRRLVFDLKLIRAEDPRTGMQRVTRSHFNINQLRDNEAVIQLLQEVEGPQDIELQLDMNIYSREFQQNNEEVFFGTAVARIFIYVTQDEW